MKRILFILTIFTFISFNSFAQTKKDGTPDMRYNANKQSYSTPTYSEPKKSTPRTYSNGGEYKVQKGYEKSNGTYVEPHIKTSPDDKTWNNAKPKKIN